MMARWETRLGLPAGEMERRLLALDDRQQLTYKDDEVGARSEAQWIAGLRDVMQWEEPTLGAFMQDFRDVYSGHPNPELYAYLANLRPRYRTALLSNSGDGARREEEKRYHFSEIIERVIYSHGEGTAKPDPHIYAITCERLGVQLDEMVFLDDAERNVAAASEYGIHAILYRDKAQAIADINVCLAAHSA